MVRVVLNPSENRRLFQIAQRLNDLTRLRETIKENPEHALFLEEFKEMPIMQLEQLGVDRITAESFFYLKGRLSIDYLEQFRKKGRRFDE